MVLPFGPTNGIHNQLGVGADGSRAPLNVDKESAERGNVTLDIIFALYSYLILSWFFFFGKVGGAMELGGSVSVTVSVCVPVSVALSAAYLLLLSGAR